MLNNFLNIFFPESCPVCEKPSRSHMTAPICTACWQSITPYRGPICRKCGKPLVSDASVTCGSCLKDEPAFNYARSFGLYEGVLKKGLNLLKYHGKKRLAKPLSDMLLQMGPSSSRQTVEVVVPVPLHYKRLRQREFNQAALLAKNIAQHLKAELLMNSLEKIRDTSPQVGMSARERMENVKNAFQVTNPEGIKNKSIVLIDDVVTTGATIRECAKVLKKSGAGEIYALSLAHGVTD